MSKVLNIEVTWSTGFVHTITNIMPNQFEGMMKHLKSLQYVTSIRPYYGVEE